MRMALLVEAFVIAVVGIFSVVDGIRLTIMGKIQLYDVLGPGWYNIGVGGLLIIVGMIYLLYRWREKPQEVEKGIQKEHRLKMITMVAVLALYIFSMNLMGYLLSSVVFFILIHRVVGFKSWVTNIFLSTGLALSFYVIFVKWLNMIFPRGAWIDL